MEDHQHFSYAPFLLSSRERSVGPDNAQTVQAGTGRNFSDLRTKPLGRVAVPHDKDLPILSIARLEQIESE